MDLILSYELKDETGRSTRGGVASIVLSNAKSGTFHHPEFSEAGVQYAPSHTYDVELTDGRFLRVFWNAPLFDKRLDVDSLTKGPCIIAVINAFGKYELIVRSEPSLNKRLGVSISNRKGKVLLMGMGDILEDKQGAYLVAEGRETFQWLRASPSSCAHTNYTVRRPGTVPK